MVNLAEEFEKEWTAKSKQHAAVTIRNEVKDWCGIKKESAEKKWLWELLQNAIDAAKDNAVSHLFVKIVRDGDDLVFSHNGGGFSLAQVVALVSGGTSKLSLRDEIGKFGKGFLVSHVLSKQVIVQSWVNHAGESRKFKIELNRPIDEIEIETNIKDCEERLERTNQEEVGIDRGMTVFTYLKADFQSCARGLNNLKQLVPYLMAFNGRLVSISANLGDAEQTWTNEEKPSFIHEGQEFGQVDILSPDGPISCLKVESKGLEVAIQTSIEEKTIKIVDTRMAPSIFYRLPLYESWRVGVSYAINSGEFDIDSDRAFLESTPKNAEILSGLGRCMDSIAKYLLETQATDMYLLAMADVSELSEVQLNIMKPGLVLALDTLKSKSIVNCEDSQVSPELARFTSSEYLGQPMKELIPAVACILSQLYTEIPVEQEEWSTVAEHWRFLGLGLQIYTLEDLIGGVEVDIVQVPSVARAEYITTILQALITAQANSGSTPEGITAKRILLNQKSELVAGQDANVDDGVDGSLKDISSGVGWDVRRQLIDPSLLLDPAVKRFVQETLCSGRDNFATSFVLKKTWESNISTVWKSKQAEPKYLDALIEFARWIVLCYGDELHNYLSPDSLPLLCADGKVQCCEDIQSYPLLWPVEWWADGLKPYARDVGLRLVLSKRYLEGMNDDDQMLFLNSLAQIQVALQDPLFTWTSKEFEGSYAQAVSFKSDFSAKVEVPNCSDLLVLQDLTSAVVGSKDLDRASRVLRLVMEQVVEIDKTWENPISLVDGRSVYPSFWLAVLKTKSWLPASDKKSFEPLDRENLERLLGRLPDLKPSPRVVRFLDLHFGINLSSLLALKLKNISPSDPRVTMMDGLLALPVAEGVKVAQDMKDHLEEVRRVQENQLIGKAVEKIVHDLFESEGFKVEWTGVGSDLGLLEPEQVGSASLKMPGEDSPSIFIEVKSARANMVRLTLPQADKAVEQKGRFILCVADLRLLNPATS